MMRTPLVNWSPDSGDVTSPQGTRVPARWAQARWRQQFGYMPQNIQLELDLSVIEVVVLGRLDSLSMRLADEDILAAAAPCRRSASPIWRIAPLLLSGGQRQMVLFAQVLLRDPRIMMLDEPVSALDLHHQMQLMEHLCQQTQDQQWITLVVLHDLNLAAQFADQLIVLAGGAICRPSAPRPGARRGPHRAPLPGAGGDKPRARHPLPQNPAKDIMTQCCATPATSSPTRWREATMNAPPTGGTPGGHEPGRHLLITNGLAFNLGFYMMMPFLAQHMGSGWAWPAGPAAWSWGCGSSASRGCSC